MAAWDQPIMSMTARSGTPRRSKVVAAAWRASCSLASLAREDQVLVRGLREPVRCVRAGYSVRNQLADRTGHIVEARRPSGVPPN